MVSTGQKIRALREALTFSQADFARLLAVSERTVRAWESDVRAPSPIELVGIGAMIAADPSLFSRNDAVFRGTVAAVNDRVRSATAAATIPRRRPPEPGEPEGQPWYGTWPPSEPVTTPEA